MRIGPRIRRIAFALEPRVWDEIGRIGADNETLVRTAQQAARVFQTLLAPAVVGRPLDRLGGSEKIVVSS
jgi:hypothetical protein